MKIVLRIPLALSSGLRRDAAQMSFTDTYGYRGSDRRLYYLSPWEFTKWWRRQPLYSPDWYHRRGQQALTAWTESGLKYCEADWNSKTSVPKAGVHYKVVEPGSTDNYVVFPDVVETALVRHRWVLVRRERPDVT